MNPTAALIVIHLAVFLVLALFWKAGRLLVPKEMLMIVLLLPVFGFAICIIAHHMAVKGSSGNRIEDTDIMRADTVEEEAASQQVKPDSGSAVPLEDALLLNDAETKRSVMMDVLLSDMDDYVPSLSLARTSTDTEISHYASAAMMQISRNYEEALAQLQISYEQNPNDLHVIEQYADLLQKHLDQGFSDGQLAAIERRRLEEVLKQKIHLEHRVEDCIALGRSLMISGDMSAADQLITGMEQSWPDDENVWLLRLRYCYMMRQPQQIDRLIEEMSRKHPSRHIRDIIDFWQKA